MAQERSVQMTFWPANHLQHWHILCRRHWWKHMCTQSEPITAYPQLIKPQLVNWICKLALGPCKHVDPILSFAFVSSISRDSKSSVRPIEHSNVSTCQVSKRRCSLRVFPCIIYLLNHTVQPVICLKMDTGTPHFPFSVHICIHIISFTFWMWIKETQTERAFFHPQKSGFFIDIPQLPLIYCHPPWFVRNSVEPLAPIHLQFSTLSLPDTSKFFGQSEPLEPHQLIKFYHCLRSFPHFFWPFLPLAFSVFHICSLTTPLVSFRNSNHNSNAFLSLTQSPSSIWRIEAKKFKVKAQNVILTCLAARFCAIGSRLTTG